jgi:hypothetical protein
MRAMHDGLLETHGFANVQGFIVRVEERPTLQKSMKVP